MMFVPFTGIDNHRRCVTIAAGLIRNESAESYIWLLQSFMKTFGKEPIMVVTDQDKSMKKAINTVFKTSKHRLCMWHITQKLPTKIHEAIPDLGEGVESNFKKRFDKIVWNMYLEPSDFEVKWEELMHDFALKNDSWFKYMYDIRTSWIPAYFIESPMFGLMRTTSRSESENSFFSHFTNQGSNLVNFMNSFESAMLKQRSKQEALDVKTMKTAPKFNTPLKIEKHAAKVYTQTIFLIIQKEITAAIWSCSLSKITTEDACEISIVKDQLTNTNEASEQEPRLIEFKVLHNREDGSIVCTCRHYLRYGLLCRHIFCVLKNSGIDEIPKQHIMRRWKRDIIPPEMRARINRYGDQNVGIQKLVNEVSSVVDDCVHLLRNDEKRLATFLEKVKELKAEVENDVPNPPSNKKQHVIEKLIGVSKPDTIEIQNPPVGKYKGCGRDKRFKSAKEIGIENSKKIKKSCRKCGGINHNIRTCDKL